MLVHQRVSLPVFFWTGHGYVMLGFPLRCGETMRERPLHYAALAGSAPAVQVLGGVDFGLYGWYQREIRILSDFYEWNLGTPRIGSV